MRCIPELIYAIEQFEKELIKLGKKTKVSCLTHSTHCYSHTLLTGESVKPLQEKHCM